MPCPGRVFYLRVRLSLTFTSGSPQSLASGRRPLCPCGFLLECPSGSTVHYYSFSGGWDLAGACRLSGAGCAAGTSLRGR